MSTCRLRGPDVVAIPPGPDRPLRIEVHSLGASTPVTVLMDLIRRYGDFVRYRTQFGVFSLVNHPSLVREVLHNSDYIRNGLLKTVLGDGVLSSNGPHWEHERRLMLPVFRPRSVEAMVDTFRRVAEERIETWQGRRSPAGTLDMSREMFRVALSNIGQVLFEADLDDAFLDAVDCIMRGLSVIQNASMFGFPLLRGPNFNREYGDAMRRVEETIGPLVARTHGGGCPHSRLLSLFSPCDHAGGKEPAPPQQIRDEILTMVTAGHETTAVSLCWALHSLAANPEVRERFYREVDEVLGQRPITAEDLPRLVYTRMVVDETLRVYPPVWVVARTAVRDMELGGYQVPAGSGVLVSPYAVHRNPDFWPNPERFSPDRFASADEDRVACSYLPFFAGRHLCLGKHFALAEMIVVLATVAQRFELRLVDDRPVEFESLVSLRVKDGLFLNVAPRSDRGRPC